LFDKNVSFSIIDYSQTNESNFSWGFLVNSKQIFCLLLRKISLWKTFSGKYQFYIIYATDVYLGNTSPTIFSESWYTFVWSNIAETYKMGLFLKI